MDLEGVVSKLRDAPYRSERTDSWIKVKCLQITRLEVIGYKEGVSSLYLGKREGDEFLYAGKVGTGYTNKMIAELRPIIKPLTRKTMPLTRKPPRKKIDHWVEPKYWAEVEYRDITADGVLRHVTFRGLYRDRSATTAVVTKFK